MNHIIADDLVTILLVTSSTWSAPDPTVAACRLGVRVFQVGPSMISGRGEYVPTGGGIIYVRAGVLGAECAGVVAHELGHHAVMQMKLEVEDEEVFCDEVQRIWLGRFVQWRAAARLKKAGGIQLQQEKEMFRPLHDALVVA